MTEMYLDKFMFIHMLFVYLFVFVFFYKTAASFHGIYGDIEHSHGNITYRIVGEDP